MEAIANARYLLMSASLSQKLEAQTTFAERLLLGFTVTDEIFGITIAKPGNISPYYPYGALMIAAPCWALGTALGIIAGNVLPGRIVSALSVALFGMFMAIIIPPCKNDSKLRILVLLSFAISFLWDLIPFFQVVSSGTKTIILTLIISSGAALLWPRKEDDNA
jgi:predicted branched-subunit amino acid permease